MSLTLSMYQQGWSEAEAFSALMDSRNRGGGYLRTCARRFGEGTARLKVKDLFAKARTRVGRQPAIASRQDAVLAIEVLRAAADDRRWEGREGTTDRATLEALLTLAERGGGLIFRASERQVAEHANIRRQTARRATQRLTAAGWLVREQRGHGDLGTTWRLRQPTNETAPVPRRERMTTGSLSFADLIQHDACTRGALGSSGARILDLVLTSDVHLTASQMAEVLGLSAKTVRARLRQVASAGLADADLDRTWRPLTVEPSEVLARLDSLAFWVGTAGRQEDRRSAHAMERAPYLERVQAVEDAKFDAQRRRTFTAVEGGRGEKRSPAIPARQSEARGA